MPVGDKGPSVVPPARGVDSRVVATMIEINRRVYLEAMDYPCDPQLQYLDEPLGCSAAFP